MSLKIPKIVATVFVFVLFGSQLANGQTPSQNVVNQVINSSTPTFPSANGKTTFFWPATIHYSAMIPENEAGSTSFKIRSDLSLHVVKHYTFTFTPNKDDFQGTGQSIENGWYLMKMVVVLPDQKSIARKQLGLPERLTPEERYVTSERKLVRLVNGTINENINLHFGDVTALWLQTLLYVQLTPVKQETLQILPNGYVNVYNTKVVIPQPGIRAVTAYIPFVPNRESDSRATASPTKEDLNSPLANLDEYLKRVEENQKIAAQPLVGAAQFAKDHNYHALNADSPEFQSALVDHHHQLPYVNTQFNYKALADLFPISTSSIQSMPDDLDATLARALCTLLLKDQNPSNYGPLYYAKIQPLIQRCSWRPHDYLRFSKAIHTLSVRPGASHGEEQVSYRYNVVSNFAVTRSNSSDTFSGVSLKPEAFFFVSAFSKIIGAIPLAVGFSTSQTDSFSTSRGGIAQSVSSMIVTPYLLEIPVNRYQTCLVVEPISEQFNFDIVVNGLYICEGERQNINLTERYYYAFQDVDGRYDASVQAVDGLMRGERDFNLFAAKMRDFANPVKDDQESTSQTFRRAKSLFTKMPWVEPGVIIYPIEKTSYVESHLRPKTITTPGILSTVNNWIHGRTTDGQ